MNFSLGAGSTLLASAGSWGSAVKEGVTGQTNVIATNSATFYVTGVQLETGTTATPFEYLQYGQQYALCQRYYQTILDANQSYVNAGMHVGGRCQFNTEMRANPTMTSSVLESGNVNNSYVYHKIRTNSLSLDG